MGEGKQGVQRNGGPEPRGGAWKHGA
jgi:hypothetical protein